MIRPAIGHSEKRLKHRPLLAMTTQAMVPPRIRGTETGKLAQGDTIMSAEFAIAEVMLGKLNALVKNIMRQTGETDPNEAVRLVNSGECAVSRLPWHEKEGVIYFSVTSDGTTGEEWIKRLKREELPFYVEDCVRQVLCSLDFKPTSGVTTKVAVLKGMLFEEQSWITTTVYAEADRRKLLKTNAELACLIREKFTDEEIEAMGLRNIVVMHEPIKGDNNQRRLLEVSRYGFGNLVGACLCGPFDRWGCQDGFAFAVSQNS